MNYQEINEIHNQYIKNDIIKDEYEWNEKYLKENLQGCLMKERELYKYVPGKELTEEQINQNHKINEINKIINKYNYKFENNEEIKEKLNNLYNEINCEHWMLNKSDILEQLNFGKRILLTGPGGIGKSQYIYDLYNNSKNLNYKKCFIYGKYSDEISEELLIKVIEEINVVSKKEKILFVIDAINEFSNAKRKIIYNFLKERKKNIRVILSCRDFSIDDSEMNKLYENTDEQIPFSGVDAVDSIQKISEKCNIDLTKYEEIMYDNNPLHLNIIKNIISNNRLENSDYNSIVVGTDIYEQYIKNTTGKYDKDKSKYWKNTKKLIKIFVDNDISYPKIQDVQNILGIETEDYFYVMKREGFIDIKDEMVIFRNETLEAYLIAREMFERLPKKESDIIAFLKNKIKKFPFIHEQLIIMLFDKVSNMKKVSRIIKNTELRYYFRDVRFLNRIKFSREKRKKFIKVFKYKGSIEDILFSGGGFENNPLNCVNYLNSIIINGNTNFNFKCSDIDSRYAKIHLTTWIRTIATFECNKDYIEEKFWFSIWCLSVANKNIRYLARKLIYEIIQKDSLFTNELIKLYLKIEDEFIKEGIIHVLCSQEMGNLKIKRFINKINTGSLINFKSLYYISKYLYGEEKYSIFSKENVLENNRNNKKNEEIYNFLKRVLFIQKEEYSILGMDTYGDEIKYIDKFIKEDKKKIININKYINRYWKCKEYCRCSTLFKNDIIGAKYGKVNERLVSDNKIYLAWQSIFKKELKKYNVKYKDLENLVVYENENNNAAYKALEIANNKILGSLACNYFSNEFKIDENGNNGYLEYDLESHTEIINLNNPITIFSEDIEFLNNKIMKNIELPEKQDGFNLEWANDKELSLINFKNIIKPIKYKNKKWIMIYGSIKLKLQEEDLKWSDEYIVNLSIDENYTLINNPSLDRLYTIETRSYNGNINDYYKSKYTQSTSIDKSSFWNKFFVESDYNLPPTQIINEFNLIYNNKLSAWTDENDNIVVLISNNKDSWYKHGVTGSVFIDEKYFNILKEKYNLKFFGFTERFFEHYRDESSLQIEYIDETNIKTYLHYVEGNSEIENTCQDCLLYKKSKKQEKKGKKTKIDKILLKYLIESEEIV